MTLTPPATLEPTRRMDVRLHLLRGANRVRHLARVHLHCLASETVAQVYLLEGKQMEPGTSGLAQLRTVDPLVVVPGDRFIIRQFSPVITVGGGAVLDAFPLRRTSMMAAAAREFLGRLEQASPIEALRLRTERRRRDGLSRMEARKETGRTLAEIDADVQRLVEDGQILAAGDRVLFKSAALEVAKQLLGELEAFHKANPLVAGIAKETLRERLQLNDTIFSFLLAQLTAGKKIEWQGEQVRLAGRGVTMSSEEVRARQTIEQAFSSAGLKVPLLKDVLATLSIDRGRGQKIITLLLRDGILVKLGDELVFHRSALQQLRAMVAAEKIKTPKMDVGRFKDLTGVTRKHAIPLLEYLDREHVTRRVGDVREIL